MPSSTFRLLSLAVTVALLLSLGAVIAFVLQRSSVPASTTSPVSSIAAGTALSGQSILSEQTVVHESSALPARTAETPPASATRSELSPQLARTAINASTPSTPASTTPAPTAEPAILRPTPTPTPPTARQIALDLANVPPSGWYSYSDGNQVHDLTVVNSTIWAATGGGVVAWNRTNQTAEKFTTLEGLGTNRTTAVVNCPIADFGLLFGTDQGLQTFDSRRGRWQLLSSTNSDIHHDDIATLHCDVANGNLIIGYREHGLDIFDEATGEWRLLNQSSGLESEVVKAIATVGDLEAVWVATAAGVSVLTPDGAFIFDRANSPLETDQISALTSDANGKVWLGSAGRVYAIDGEQWTIYSPTYVLASRFPTGEITALELDNSGALWIASALGELCRFDTDAVTCDRFFEAIDLTITSAITALAVDDLDRIYVATAADGIRFYDGTRWRPFVLSEPLRGNRFQAITQDVAGYLWLKTEAGLMQLDPTQPYSQTVITAPLPTAGPTDNGVTALLFTAQNSAYPIDSIETLIADDTAGIWVGGQNAGYFDGTVWRQFTRADGLIDRQVNHLTIDGARRTWFGTANGLSIWNGDSFFNLTQQDGLPSNRITALLYAADAVWIGTDAGLLRFAENRLQIYDSTNSELPSDQIQALTLANDGTLLIGTTAGLARMRDTTITVEPELAGESITAVAAMPDDVLWLASADNGLVYFDGVRWRATPDAIVPPSPTISLLFVDRQNTLWVGGNGGLLRYVP